MQSAIRLILRYAFLAILLPTCPPAHGQKDGRKPPDVIPPPEELPRAMVEFGELGLALKYYREIGIELGLLDEAFQAAPLDPNEAEAASYLALLAPHLSMRKLMDYAGFESLTVVDALKKKPAELKAGHSGLLSVRYFSPKISDVSGGGGETPLPFNFGWRKIVRLEAREGFPAKARGVRRVWVLFNVFSKADPVTGVPLGGDPFVENGTVDNQLIVEREAPVEGGPQFLKKPLYWFVFGTVNEQAGDAPLDTALDATFDARDPLIIAGEEPTTVRKYFVPEACADCHGGLKGGPNFARAKLNFVDTDHFFDRVQVGDDFAPLTQAAGLSVLLDGGKTPAEGAARPPEGFEQVFADFRVLNGEIAKQNDESVKADPAAPTPEKDFALRAVNKWIALHGADREKPDEHKPPFDRALDGGTPQLTWKNADPTDRELLPLLNRFCYRCHSSLAYSVFDKRMVLDRARLAPNLPKSLRRKINPLPPGSNNTPQMPQDRKLDAAQLAELNRLIDALIGSTPP